MTLKLAALLGSLQLLSSVCRFMESDYHRPIIKQQLNHLEVYQLLN